MQYNAIMLIRILVDNPGHTFTRNLDAKFVATTKLLLRNGRDMRVQHFLRETLQALEAQRSWDDDLSPLLEMWGKEKDKLKRTSSTVSPAPWFLFSANVSSPPGGRRARQTRHESRRLSFHVPTPPGLCRRPMNWLLVLPRRRHRPIFSFSLSSRRL